MFLKRGIYSKNRFRELFAAGDAHTYEEFWLVLLYPSIDERQSCATTPFQTPGQRWQGYLVPKRPQFERGVRATASICNNPVLLADEPYATPLIAIQRLRHFLRKAMQQTLGDARYGPVLIALAIGDQAGIALVADNQVLRQAP